MAYAVDTRVPVERSQGEIRKILERYGASGFAFAETLNCAIVMFEMAGRRIKFMIPMPLRPDLKVSQAERGRYDQRCRSKWRCLVLAIKAKLECVESGITTLEQEFMAHIVLPNGSTVGDMVIPQIDQSYREGKMPPLLGHSG